MEINKTYKIVIGVAVIALIAVGYFVYDRNSYNTSGNNATTTSQEIASSTSLSQAGTLNSSQYKIERVDISNKSTVKFPDLSRPVVFGSNINFTTEQKDVIKSKIENLQATLKNNPKDLSAWLDLGNYQKMAGDYDGAIISWKYEGDISNDFIGYGNIGFVYAYYIHDNGLAEVYYKKAVERAPTQETVYVQLAEMYRDVFKDKDKALSMINEGLSKIPNGSALLEFKASLSK